MYSFYVEESLELVALLFYQSKEKKNCFGKEKKAR